MQILLGSQSTLVKIQDSRKNFQHILNFIETQFEDRVVKKNAIYLPENNDEKYKRAFLMKWIYAYYTRKYNKAVPNLKEVLMNRVAKPIHLDLPVLQDEPFEIDVEFVSGTRCRLKSNRANPLYDKGIQRYFRSMEISKGSNANCIEITTNSDVDKARLKFFFSLNKLNTVSLNFIYDDQKMESFFMLKQLRPDISNACRVLNVRIDDSLKTIRKNYLYLAKKCHPDLLSDKAEHHIKKATEDFQSLLAAFDIMKVHKQAS